MVCVLVCLLFLLTEVSASQSSSGTERASPCPPRWLLLGERCFALYPVWSSWSSAESLCSQSGGHLASLHTPEDRKFVHQLANTNTSVWLGGYHTHKNSSWFWSDDPPLRIDGWTNQKQGETGGGGACMSITPKSGELHGAPCGELRFYICSTRASSSLSNKPVESGLVSGVSLFDVVWSFSDSLAEEILRSSSFVARLRSGRLTRRCYERFVQQEALYLQRVSSTLEVLMTRPEGDQDVRSLLQDTHTHYSSRNQSLLSSPPPEWLLSSLQSLHSVVQEDPVYLLVALSARSCLRHFLSRELPAPGVQVTAGNPEQEWRGGALMEVTWTHRYRKVLEAHQDHVDVFRAVNVFREHMMNQKSFYRALNCDDEEEEEDR
ncbi:uncharacterized protein LOC131989295 [Centropristis striata]|uniref:uncharacterized protein LOC131989295 n=1 Tax=Centropristis striata TaxID=184440 RepID=UPI0027E0BCAD|nr:uncharacterized protein LOC131989295 [Centropristis striata]